MESPASERVVVMAHGDCADGFTSAGLLRRRFPHARVVYTHPSELRSALEELSRRPPPDRLILADLSPQKKDLEELGRLVTQFATSAKVTWIDHHAPQWPPEFESSMRKQGIEVVLDRDEKESGASLSAQWTREDDPEAVRIANLIRLRDAWIEPHNEEARQWTLVALRLGPTYVDRLAKGRLQGLEEQGKRFLKEQEEQIQELLASVREHTPAVRYLWGEDDISDVADRVFRADPRAVLLLRFGPSGRVSIRSRARRPVAAPLAQQFGGGGHANAAGFTLRMGPARRLLFRARGTHDRRVRDVLEAAEAKSRSP